jgi:hypothetical protein
VSKIRKGFSTEMNDTGADSFIASISSWHDVAFRHLVANCFDPLTMTAALCGVAGSP